MTVSQGLLARQDVRTSLYLAQSAAMGAATRWSGMPKESISSLQTGMVDEWHEQHTLGQGLVPELSYPLGRCMCSIPAAQLQCCGGCVHHAA